MNSRRYFFDLGNTRLKLWAYEGDALVASLALVHAGRPTELLLANLPGFELAPQSIQGASVLSAQQNQDFVAAAQDRWAVLPQLARVAAVTAGVSCAYAEPARLGIDRWLGVLAVADGLGDYVVVDGGTALTIDVLSRQREHLGGFILPGLDMMAQALTRGTQQIVVRQATVAQPVPGRSTEEAVVNGALQAVLGAIERTIAQLERQGRAPQLVLTGGGVAPLLPYLQYPYRYEPELLLQGLQRYFAEQ